ACWGMEAQLQALCRHHGALRQAGSSGRPAQPQFRPWCGPQLARGRAERGPREQGPVPHLPGPFITRLLLTVTDGSGPQLAPHQRQNHTAREPTDSWSAMSSGEETAAINNPRHMIRAPHGRRRGRYFDGGLEGRCHAGWSRVYGRVGPLAPETNPGTASRGRHRRGEERRGEERRGKKNK
ncbi:hypothetical protein P4O66_016810, partial [Electrophorus voltai]